MRKSRTALKLTLGMVDSREQMHWKKIKERYKKRYSWLFKKEDVLMKVLIATSGLFIGLIVGKGLQALFSTVS
ncbi:MAG: hypothetical protein H8E86_01450 [Planctomycetes bacterium]|nr:hypothetical protein [Planctomycetota bacterium]